MRSRRSRRRHPSARLTLFFFFAHRRPDLSLSCSRAQQDKEHHKGEEDVRTLPVKMGSSPPKSNMSK